MDEVTIAGHKIPVLVLAAGAGLVLGVLVLASKGAKSSGSGSASGSGSGGSNAQLANAYLQNQAALSSIQFQLAQLAASGNGSSAAAVNPNYASQQDISNIYWTLQNEYDILGAAHPALGKAGLNAGLYPVYPPGHN